MQLGMEVGLAPSDFVLDGNQLGGKAPPNFRPISIEPNGWMDEGTS